MRQNNSQPRIDKQGIANRQSFAMIHLSITLSIKVNQMPRSTLQTVTELLVQSVNAPDEGDGETVSEPAPFSMSLRVHPSVACKISVMAEFVGQSRNEMANTIIEAGLDAIFESLPDNTVALIEEQVSAQITDFYDL